MTKRQITSVLLVLLPILMVITGLEVYSRTLVINDFKEKYTLFSERKDEIELLFLGASQTAKGINTDLMVKNAFNMGHEMQLFQEDLQIVDTHADELPNLEYVVFNLIPPVIESTLSGTSADQYKYYEYHYYHLKTSRLVDYLDIRTYSLLFTIGYDQVIASLFDEKLSDSTVADSQMTTTGYQYSNEETIMPSDTLNASMAIYDSYVRYGATADQINQNIQGLSETIAHLQKNNIKVALMITPATPTYQSIYEEAYKRTLDDMYTFKNTYDNVVILDYFEDDRFTLDDFSNACHLNNKGAEKMANILEGKLN